MKRILFSLFFISLCTELRADLILIRHGEGTHNVSHRHDKNATLTEKGKEQVRAAGKELRAQGFNKNTIAKVYVSPLIRTRQTAAQLIEIGLIDENQIIFEERIAEPHFGTLEGQPFISADGWDVTFAEETQAETLESVQMRLSHFYDEISSLPFHGDILVISHGIPLQELLGIIVGEKEKLETAGYKVISTDN